MRTQERGIMKGFKTIAIILFVASLSVGCGKNNTSGDSSSTQATVGWGGFGGGTYVGGNGNSLPSNWMDIVAQENTCYQGGTRAATSLTVNANVNVGALYVGVTSYGDISVIRNENGQSVMHMYICPRDGLNGQGNLTSQVVVENSQSCPMGQISNADIQLGSQYGQPYYLAFRPIHIQGYVSSSLCQNY
ncbi:MAG: hypothetical protein KC478_09160 [Bacteriovoracaceae bacterium]|nr:hypothetical protein [Bacteriovoracaceae bacterium]